jgi:hypothetical protein
VPRLHHGVSPEGMEYRESRAETLASLDCIK